MILGVAVSEIEKLARAGESYEQAAARINKAKEADKTITKNPKKSNTVKS